MQAQHRDDGDGDGDTALMASLSFRKSDEDDDDDEALISALDCGSPQQISAAPREAPDETGDGDGVDSDDDDFEFAFLLRDPETGARISAGDVFASGQIRPVYPVFGRRLLPDVAPRGGAAEDEKEVEVSVQSLQHLFVEEREAKPTGSASDDDEEVDLADISEVPPESHCAPGSSASPARCKKSNSTGSLLRWRIKDLVMGRSHSDGKEKFVFLAAEKREPESKDEKKAAEAVAFKEKRNWSGGHRPRTSHDWKTQPAAAADKDKEGKQTKGVRVGGTKAVEMDMATAHQMFYGNASRPAKGAPRRSFLPYKRDLFGLFASTNGLSRTYHPL